MIVDVFDIEVYPVLFSLASIDYETKDRELYVISEEKNDIDGVMKFIKRTHDLRVGHNILFYDNLILGYISNNYKVLKYKTGLEICKDLKMLSDRIIQKDRKEPWPKDIGLLFKALNWKSFDTLAIMNTIDRVGLKQVSVNLKYPNVQELPFPPDTILTKEEISTVLKYNFNDVEISCLLYEKKIPDYELRKDVSERYDVDVMNSNDTGIAKKILNKYYSEYTELEIDEFKDLRSYNKPFLLKELVPEIKFKTKEFQQLYEWFKIQEITEKTTIDLEEKELEKKKPVKIKYDVLIDGIGIRFGLGGVHSLDKPDIFVSDEKYSLYDCDFASYYPNLLINNQIKPRHVKHDFITIISTLTKERIRDKVEGRKKDADVKKIIINSIYGLLGSDYYWLKDIKALLSITITGQLWLAKFAEDLIVAGIQVISLNTDGIVCRIKNEQEEEYRRICNSISEQLNIDVEFTKYKKYIRKDVNNYISIDDHDKIKQKGKYFSTEIQISKGYYYPIVSIALNNYYTKNIPIQTTIRENKDVFNFMSSQKVDTGKFDAEIKYYQDGEIKIDKLQKINRWIVTKTGSKLNKFKRENGKNIMVEKDSFVTILNKVENNDAHSYNINYSFYQKLCNDVISTIEHPQILTLF